MDQLYVAIVCSSNMNRSMEAHAYLATKGFNVKSFGTGDKVRLPGKSAYQPNCYEFGFPYEDIYKDLSKKDKAFYTHNGLLRMLDRNRQIKKCPEKFQLSTERFNVIITCEKRVYKQVIEWFGLKPFVYNQPVHIINIDIQDNLEEATIGSFHIADMLTIMAQSADLDIDMDELLRSFEAKCHIPILSCVMFY